MKTHPLTPLIRQRLSSERGLTLVEIIVVLVILSVLVGFLTGSLFSQGDKAKAKITELQLKKVQSAINQYQLMYNQLPADIRALTTCNEQAGTACIKAAEEGDLSDAWGTPFSYKLEGNARSYTLKSLGADRKEGGSDVNGDITVTGP